MRYGFQNGEWSLDHARFQVAEYMTHLGYGGSGPKAYKKEKDEPTWFPDSLSWELFEHPSRASKDVLNKIMRAIMNEYEIPETHHMEKVNENGEIVSSKKKRKRKSRKNRARKDKDNENVDTSNDVDTSADSNADNHSSDSYENLLEASVKTKKKTKQKD